MTSGPSSAVGLFLFFNQISDHVVPDPKEQLSSVIVVLIRQVMTEPVWLIKSAWCGKVLLLFYCYLHMPVLEQNLEYSELLATNSQRQCF